MKSDMILPEDFNGVKIHFVGIKGTGMVALVEILRARGAIITGSDVPERFYTDEILEKLGIKALPFSEQNVTKDTRYVIYSSAYSPEKNPDLKKASELSVPMMLYSEALGAYSRTCRSSGICGVHGKTTTTGLAGTILKSLPLSTQVLAGSVISSFGNSCTCTSNQDKGEKKYFVAETCEYQRHFMSFCPKSIILTSVESDHQDYYPTFNDIQNAFVDYILKLPENGTLIYCADDKGAVETAGIAKSRRNDLILVPYGENATGEYRISDCSVENGMQYFNLGCIGKCALSVPGFHNVRNAAAAVALSVELLKDSGLDEKECFDSIRQSLKSFAGGKRRSEIIARKKTKYGDDVIIVDDYGHHPTAIKTTLKGYKDFYKDYRIVVDFMSHTYSRTESLLEEFASSFESADFVIINKIYGSARERASDHTVTGKILADRAVFYSEKYGNSVVYAEEFDDAFEEVKRMLDTKLEESCKGWLFVSMGAGDNWKVGKKLAEYLC